jgi:hypothetical protein
VIRQHSLSANLPTTVLQKLACSVHVCARVCTLPFLMYTYSNFMYGTPTSYRSVNDQHTLCSHVVMAVSCCNSDEPDECHCRCQALYKCRSVHALIHHMMYCIMHCKQLSISIYRSWAFESRLLKYARRGFTIGVPGFKREDCIIKK